MNRNLLILLASVVALGCSDLTRPTAPEQTDNTQHPIKPATVEITGTVVVNDADTEQRTVEILLADGSLIHILGDEAARLASVRGAEVSVFGTFDAPPGLVAERFQVLAMNGRAALDGVVELTDGGLALRLFDGSLRYPENLPATLADYVGWRVWIIGTEEPPVEFGVIDAI